MRVTDTFIRLRAASVFGTAAYAISAGNQNDPDQSSWQDLNFGRI